MSAKSFVFKTPDGVSKFVDEEFALRTLIKYGRSPYSDIEDHRMYSDNRGTPQIVYIAECDDGYWRVLFPKCFNKELSDYYKIHGTTVGAWKKLDDYKIPFGEKVIAKVKLPSFAVGLKSSRAKGSARYITGQFKEFPNLDWRFVSNCGRFTVDLDYVSGYILLSDAERGE